MFARDVHFEGFNSRDWVRVLELFRPLRADRQPRDEERPRDGVVAVHRDGHVVKLVHTRAGRLRLDEVQQDWPLDAKQLAHRHAASWGVSLEMGVLDAVMESLGAQLRREHDLLDQCLLLLRLLQERQRDEQLDVWPRRLAGVPIPSRVMVDRSLDSVCPAGKTMLLGLFDSGHLWTSIAIRRSEEGIDLILGPAEIRQRLGLLSGDMRRDHRHLARAVSEVTGPLSLGCFAEREVFRALEVDPTPGAWALAVAVRDVVINPAPVAVALPLGLDAGRAAFVALREIAARVDTLGVINPAISAIRDATIGERSVEGLLGFDVLEVLRRLLERER